MPVAALDIGYSNLKVASGRPGGPPRVIIRPAGAAPAERLGERIRPANPDTTDAPIFVDLQGRRWAAGIEPARLDGWVRSLHADYASTDAYLALVVAGELRRSASGTSLEAMSVLLERAARQLAEVYGGKPTPLALEGAVRAGRANWLQAGHTVTLEPVLRQAATEVAGVALEALRQALRREEANVDLVLLAGGGGALYGATLGRLFPGATVVVSDDPVAANVRGFFRHVR